MRMWPIFLCSILPSVPLPMKVSDEKYLVQLSNFQMRDQAPVKLCRKDFEALPRNVWVLTLQKQPLVVRSSHLYKQNKTLYAFLVSTTSSPCFCSKASLKLLPFTHPPPSSFSAPHSSDSVVLGFVQGEEEHPHWSSGYVPASLLALTLLLGLPHFVDSWFTPGCPLRLFAYVFPNHAPFLIYSPLLGYISWF